MRKKIKTSFEALPVKNLHLLQANYKTDKKILLWISSLVLTLLYTDSAAN